MLLLVTFIFLPNTFRDLSILKLMPCPTFNFRNFMHWIRMQLDNPAMPPTFRGLMDLDKEENFLWNPALSPATQIAYNSAMFCDLHADVRLCLTYAPIARYYGEHLYILCYTLRKSLNLKHSTIKLYLCGIRFKYMQAGIQSPFTTDRNNMPLLATILKAIKQDQSTSAKLRTPITYNILTMYWATRRSIRRTQICCCCPHA